MPARAQEGEGAAEVEAFVEEMVASFNAGDPEAFAALFTDEGIIAFVDDPEVTTREQAIEAIGEFMGFAEVQLLDTRDVEVADGTASAIVELDLGGFVSIDLVELTDVDGTWLVSNYVTGVEQPPLPEIPAGYKTIPVDMVEYEFILDTGQIMAGDLVAFEATNAGEEPHELVLARIPADLDLEGALESPEPPEGVEDIAFTFAEPGQTGIAIAPDALAAGRYVIVCFVPSPEGVPHAVLGMYTEFTLDNDVAPEAPGVGSGMEQNGSWFSGYLAALGAAIALIGFGGGTLAVHRFRQP